jgi:hypothetical protein
MNDSCEILYEVTCMAISSETNKIYFGDEMPSITIFEGKNKIKTL